MIFCLLYKVFYIVIIMGDIHKAYTQAFLLQSYLKVFNTVMHPHYGGEQCVKPLIIHTHTHTHHTTLIASNKSFTCSHAYVCIKLIGSTKVLSVLITGSMQICGHAKTRRNYVKLSTNVMYRWISVVSPWRVNSL